MKVFLFALFVAVVSASPVPDEDGGAVEMIVNGLAPGEPLEIADIVDIKLHEHSEGEVVATNLLHQFTAVGLAEVAAAAEEQSAFDPNSVILARSEVIEEVLPAPVVLPEATIPEVALPAPVVLPEAALPEVALPEPVVLPEAAAPEVALPAPVVLPEAATPEVALPAPVILPEPAIPEVVLPEPVVLPEAVAPEVVLPEPVVLPEAAAPEVAAPVEIPAVVEQKPDNEVYNDGLVSVTVNVPEQPGVFYTLQSWLSVVMNYFSSGVQTTQQII